MFGSGGRKEGVGGFVGRGGKGRAQPADGKRYCETRVMEGEPEFSV